MFLKKFRFEDFTEKCVGCFLVYPFLGGFFIKKCKKNVYMWLCTCENVFFGLKKGYKRIIALGSPKTYCRNYYCNKHFHKVQTFPGFTQKRSNEPW